MPPCRSCIAVQVSYEFRHRSAVHTGRFVNGAFSRPLKCLVDCHNLTTCTAKAWFKGGG